ncbi:MAG: ammonium transporter [Alphaproteobacteria bacterium]
MAPVHVDTGNTTWLLLSAALVMLMTPGLAFFYAGMVHRKNVVSTLLQNYVALALVGILWVVAGYSLVFTEHSPYIGGLKYAMLHGVDKEFYQDTGIPLMAYMAFQMMFAIITPALITGAFAERVNFKAWLIIMAIWSMVVYVPVAHWVWGPGGWLADLGALDFAGGLVVHITAGVSALACGLLFGSRQNREEVKPNDVPQIMLGAALLWFGWFGFNAGSAVTAGALAAYAFVNTFIAAAAAFLAWMVIEWLHEGRPTAVGASVGLVVGLVAITPAAGYVTVSSALIIGTVASFVAYFAAKAVKKITHLDDALDVFACHGIGGIVGAILTGCYASKEVNAAGVPVEGLFVSGETKLFFANLESVGVVVVFAFVMTIIIVKLVNLFVPIRVGVDAEGHGLDLSTHGERARHEEPSEMNPYSWR